MTSRHNLPNQGGSGRYRGGSKPDGPMNSLVDLFKRAAPHWHERLAGRALSEATGINHGLSTSIIETINVLIGDYGETGETIRIRLNPTAHSPHNPAGFGVRAAGEQRPLDFLRRELDL